MKVNNWVYNSNDYRIAEVSQVIDVLPAGIYKTEIDRYEEIYLSKISDKFEMPSKIYGLEQDFVKRVQKSWESTTGNMGVLLNGIRGTGKTITAEIIANQSNLPVILVTDNYKGLTSFFNEIQQDCIIFIDEYDKIFERHSNTLLTIMDGALKTTSRFMFLLTTNESYLNPHMYQRPSRIRYIKTFGDLDLNSIIEIVDDMLIHKELRNKSIEFIAHMPIITIDLVKSVIEEINIHHQEPELFKSVFNYRDDDTDVYNIHQVSSGEVVKTWAKSYCSHSIPFNASNIDDDFRVGYNDVGEICEIISDNEVMVRSRIFTDKREPDEVFTIYRIELTRRKHKSFNHLAF